MYHKGVDPPVGVPAARPIKRPGIFSVVLDTRYYDGVTDDDDKEEKKKEKEEWSPSERGCFMLENHSFDLSRQWRGR